MRFRFAFWILSCSVRTTALEEERAAQRKKDKEKSKGVAFDRQVFVS